MNLKRLLTAGIAAGALVSGLAVAQPVLADLQTQQIRNVATDRCLDDSSDGLRSIGCNGLAYQLWTHGDGVVYNSKSKSCLDDSQFYGLRSVFCNRTDYQSWNQLWTDGHSVLVNRKTNRCLDDSDEYGLRAVDCNWGPNQQFSYLNG